MSTQGGERAGAAADPSASAKTDIATELRRFLELGAAQVDAALRESNSRVEKLASAVTAIATDSRALDQEVRALDPTEATRARRARIGELIVSLNAHVQASITALQFYDKLVQRLTHVREGLAIPADTAGSTVNTSAKDWQALLLQVRERYSTVEERVLFDFMMHGLTADQMGKALTGLRASAAAGEFEVF